MHHGTVSCADRLSQGVIAWPQVRRIPMKTSKKSREKRKGSVIAESRWDTKLRRPDRARDAAWKRTAAASCRACSTYASTAAIAEGLRTGRLGRMSEPDSDRAAAGVGISQPANSDRAGPVGPSGPGRRGIKQKNSCAQAERAAACFFIFSFGKSFSSFEKGQEWRRTTGGRRLGPARH